MIHPRPVTCDTLGVFNGYATTAQTSLARDATLAHAVRMLGVLDVPASMHDTLPRTLMTRNGTFRCNTVSVAAAALSAMCAPSLLVAYMLFQGMMHETLALALKTHWNGWWDYVTGASTCVALGAMSTPILPDRVVLLIATMTMPLTLAHEAIHPIRRDRAFPIAGQTFHAI